MIAFTHRIVRCGVAVGLQAVFLANTALAQDVLPPVVVTTPSPVAKTPVAAKPAQKTNVDSSATPKPKAKSATKQTKSPATSASSTPAPQPAPVVPDGTQPTVRTTDVLAPPGTLLVVDDAFAPVTVATDREILAQGGATLTDTLQSRSGITGSTFAPGANRPIIRGLDSYRVRVQENGIGSHDVSTISEDHAVPIAPFAADRIEVVRGPATLRYGSGAIGGVVAAENGRIPTAVPRNGVSGEIQGGLTSLGNGYDGAFKATAGSQGVAVHADGFRYSADDYNTPIGTERNTFAESEGFGLGLSRIWADGFFGISVSRIDSLYGVPGEEAREGVDPRIDLAQQKIQARGEWRPRAMGVEAVRFWFGASDYEHDEHARHDGGEFEIASRFKNNEQEGRIEIQHVPIVTGLGELTGAAGIQVVHRRTRGTSFEGDSLLEPARTGSVAAFLFQELQTSATTRLQAALRIEQSKIDGIGLADVTDPNAPVEFDGKRRFVPVSASLGVLQKLGFGTVARLSGQYVERAPDAAELFSSGIHEATGTFEIGNPFLEKERAFSIEAGLAKAQGPFRFDAAAYYTKYKGFVFRELQGVRCLEDLPSCGPAADLDDENFDLVLFQQRDATFFGAEIAAQYDVAPIWRGLWGVDGRYDFVRARFEGDENVPRIPPHRLGGGVYYRDSNWFARAGVLHAFDQNRFGAEEIATPGYTLVSAELPYTARLDATTRTTLGVRGENLADDDVLNHASFKRREEVLQPGASVRVFGSLKFN